MAVSTAAPPEPKVAAQSPPVPAPPPEVVRQPPSMLRLVFLILLLALAVLVFLFADQFLTSGEVTTNDAQIDCHITPIAPKISGYVVEVRVNDNMKVKKGSVMIRIDPRDYQAALDLAQAALEVAEADADKARLNIPLTHDTTLYDTSSAQEAHRADAAAYLRAQVQEEQTATAALLSARANRDGKKAQYARARHDLERYTELLREKFVSQFEYDNYKMQARVAKSDLETAEQQVIAAEQAVQMARQSTRSAKAQMGRSREAFRSTAAKEQQVPIVQAAYKSAQANVHKARAAVEQAKLNLSYCTIEAPTDGQVTQLQTEVGQYVSVGQLLFTVVPLEQAFVTANFKETQMAHVRRGQRVRIHVDTYDEDFYGVVDSIAGATGSKQALLPPQNATGNFVKVVQRIPVKILVTPLPRHPVLRPGMNVEATIITDGPMERTEERPRLRPSTSP